MNAADAAYQILTEAGEPLHSNEIAQRILARGLWNTQGKTPGATIDARIAVDIKTHGVSSRFRRVGRSTFTINDNSLTLQVESVAAVPSPERQPASTPSAASAPLEAAAAPLTLSFTDAAERVLDQFAKRHPMHYSANGRNRNKASRHSSSSIIGRHGDSCTSASLE
jgi:restriction system protein